MNQVTGIPISNQWCLTEVRNRFQVCRGPVKPEDVTSIERCTQDSVTEVREKVEVKGPFSSLSIGKKRYTRRGGDFVKIHSRIV